MSRLALELQRKIESLEKRRSDFNRDIDEKISVFRTALEREENADGIEAELRDQVETSEREDHEFADHAWIKDIIRRKSKTGIGAGQIRKAAQKAQLIMNNRFPYKALWKLKRSGAIVRNDDGLYFPASQK
jgi:hypothetical protein